MPASVRQLGLSTEAQLLYISLTATPLEAFRVAEGGGRRGSLPFPTFNFSFKKKYFFKMGVVDFSRGDEPWVVDGTLYQNTYNLPWTYEKIHCM